MTEHHPIQRIDQNDVRVQAARKAEQSLFEHYDLDYRPHSIELDGYGLRLRVLEVGSGPPLVMLPGGNGEAIQYVPMIAALEGRRVIAINRPGGGMSDAIDHRNVDLRRLAVDSLTTVLDAFELAAAPFAVNSMGGLWTLFLALERPERVSAIVEYGCPALVLGTSAPGPMRMLSVPYLNSLLFRTFRAKNSDDVRDVLGMLGCSDESRAALPEPLFEAMYRMFDLPTYRLAWLSLMESALTVRGANSKYVLGPTELKQIDQPTLLVWGDNDPFGGIKIARRAEAAIPNAELQIISGSHVPYIDNPKECARLTTEFLHQREAPSPSLTYSSRKAG